MKKTILIQTVLLATLATLLITTWDSGLQLITDLSNELSTPAPQGLDGIFSILKNASAEIGRSETLKISPYLLAHILGGRYALFVSLFFSTFGILLVVSLLARRYSSSQIALITQFVFTLSPILAKYPYDILSPFSPSFLSLIAIALYLEMPSFHPILRRLCWVPIGAISLAVHILTGWGIWLPIFLILLAVSQTEKEPLQLVVLLVLIAFIIVARTAVNNPLLSLLPETPLRSIFLAPNAIQIGYSDIIPRDLTFQLPGNNPALIILIVSPLLRAYQKPSSFKFAGLWLATSIVCNLELLITSPATAFPFLLFPICFVIAYFFEGTPLTTSSLLGFGIVFFVFSWLSSFEPMNNFVIVSTEFPGWSTSMPLRDLGQMLGGISVILIFVYIALENTAYQKYSGQLSRIIFLFLGVIQINLMHLLQTA